MDEQRIVAIHQPNYLPWIGYFLKMALCHQFVFLDDVEYTKQSLTKRSWIRRDAHSEEKTYLVVPLKKHSDFALIRELEIDHSQNWQRRQERQLQNAYSRAPFFPEFFPVFQQWMAASTGFSSLADWNIWVIRQLAQVLGLNGDWLQAGDLPIGEPLRKAERNLALVRRLGGTVYLSGMGARKYQHTKTFQEAGIDLWYLDTAAFLQQTGMPEGHFSCLDLLMRRGAEELRGWIDLALQADTTLLLRED